MPDRKSLKIPLDTKEVRQILVKQINKFLEDGNRPHITDVNWNTKTQNQDGIFVDDLNITVSRIVFEEDHEIKTEIENGKAE